MPKIKPESVPAIVPAWSVSPDGTCHSLRVEGSYTESYETARALAYERIATLGLSCAAPGIVGRGDHVLVELHVVPTPSAPTPIDLDGHHDIVGEGL